MWGPDFNTPWHPFQPGLNSEIPTLMGLGSTTSVVALIGDRQAGPRGRFGVVGIAGQVSEIKSDNSFSELQRAFDEPRRGLRVIAMGYEMGHPLVALQPQAPPLGHPKGLVIDLCGAVVFDHKTRLARVVGHERAACDRLKKNLQIGMATAPAAGTAILDPTIPDEEHSRRIQVTQDHIAAGDIYQANIARRLTVSGDINPLGLLSTAVSVHLATVLPNFFILEYQGDQAASDPNLMDNARRPVDGYFPIPTRPGLGIELDLDAVANSPPSP